MKLGERRNGRMDACVFFEEGERGKLSSGYFSPRASPRSPVRPVAPSQAQKNRQNGGLFVLVGLPPSKLENGYHPKYL